ncbi:MAG: hypothetical protein WCW66_03760 [Patescibacteria group bacterium]
MGDINLLRDKDSVQERSRKKTGAVGIEMTRPKKEKDDTGKQVKKGGLVEFFGKIFKRQKKERIISQKVIKKDEKVGKVNYERIKEYKPEKVEDNFQVEMEKNVAPVKKIVNSEPTPVFLEKREQRINKQNVILEKSGDVKTEKEEVKKPRKKFFTWSAPNENAAMKKNVLVAKKGDLKMNASENADKLVPLEEKIQALDVNLIPEDVLGKLEPKAKLKQMGIGVGIVVVLVGLVYGYMMYRESKIEGDIEELTIQIDGIDQEIKSLGNVRNDAETLRNQIDSISKILDDHIYWSQLLAYLEKYTLPNVYYKSLSATQSGVVTLSASAIDLATLADQYIVFQNATDFVEKVTIDSAISAATEVDDLNVQNSVDFNISLKVIPDIFFLKENLPI